jgi:hypothetical protein
MYFLLLAVLLNNDHPLSCIIEDEDPFCLFLLHCLGDVGAKVRVYLG